MARSEGIAIVPWNVHTGGRIWSDAQERARHMSGEKETERDVAQVLEEVAAGVGAKSIQAVAMAYVVQRVPDVIPIIGGRKVEHPYSNPEASGMVLTESHFRKTESAVPLETGVPHDLAGDRMFCDVAFANAGKFYLWPIRQAVHPSEPD